VGMADVDGLRRSCSLFLDLLASAGCSLTGARLLWSPAFSGVGSHLMKLCGAFLSGAWPARAEECSPWFSACGSRSAHPASFCVDPGCRRSLDAGRALGVGCAFMAVLRLRFSWRCCLVFLCLYLFLYILFFDHSLPFR
jgi:hypothetical protein